MRVLHQVTGCDDCPMCDTVALTTTPGQLRVICKHPLADEDGYGKRHDQAAPDECPLRAGELLIQLRVKS